MSLIISRAYAQKLFALFGMIIFSLSGCGVEEVGYPPPSDALYYPLGIAAHPDGRYLYVSNASYDRLYNASSLMAIDTERRVILPRSTVEVGLFSGELSLVRRPCEEDDCEAEVFAYLPSRDENSLTTFKIKASAGDSTNHIQCGQSSGQRRCASNHTTVRAGNKALPKSPYALHQVNQHLYMTHVLDGTVTRWRIPSATEDDMARPIFECQSSGGTAHFVTAHPVTGYAFVSDRFGQFVQVLNPVQQADGGCRLHAESPVLITDKLVSGEGRGVALSADGTLMYLASSFDGALRIYDISVGSDGKPRNNLLAAIPIGRNANAVRVAGLRPQEQRVGSQELGKAQQLVEELGRGLVYVSALDDGVIVVIDPQRLAIIARIKVGTAPHDIAFMPNQEGKLRGYVSNFKGHSISVIDLEEGSDTRFQVLDTIGGEPQ